MMPDPRNPSMPASFHETLERMLHLLSAQTTFSSSWEGWRLTAIGGGGNNRISRATNDQYDLAIKWTIRDQRHRARREYTALHAIAECGLHIAPQAVLLDEQQPQPAIVQTWLDGEVTKTPPTTDGEWLRLIEHLVTIHAVTPASVSVPLEPAVLNARNPADCRTIIQQQLELLPDAARPPALPRLLEHLAVLLDQSWADVPLTLCRVDANTTNFIRRSGAWASVDWENSGWGDPAFEIAELMTHPAYATVESSRWSWVINQYCALAGRQDSKPRIDVYHRTMLVWWVIRFARTLYDVPRGADARLVERPVGWEQETRHHMQRVIERAHAAFSIVV